MIETQKSCPCCDMERRLRELWQQTHEQRHDFEKQAVSVAAKDIERRLEGMNELRAQINNERGEYLRRDIYDREHATLRDAVEARLRLVEDRQKEQSGKSAGINVIVVGLFAIAGLLISLLNLAARLKP